MAVNFNPPLTDVLKTGEPVQKGQVSALFGVLRDAVNADLDPRATPIYASRDAAIAAAPLLPTSLLHIMVREGTALVVRSRTAFADDPLFDTGARWGVVQRQDSMLTSSLVLPRLVNVGGTPDAITADLPAGALPIATGSHVLLRPSAANTAPNPTLTIGSGFTRTLQTETGGTLATGRLVPGTFHLVNIASNGAARVVGVLLRPNELPAIREETANASAQLATLTAAVDKLINTPLVGFAIQESSKLPPRPDAPIILWFTWDDPSHLMGPVDPRFVLPQPTVPDMPQEASWDFMDAKDGSSAILRVALIPGAVPPITGIQYRIEGGAWVLLAPIKQDVTIGGLTKGQTVAAELRYLNFKGAGIPTPPRTTMISEGVFADTFNRANGPVSADPRWKDIVIGGNNRRAVISNNAAQPSASNETYVLQITEYVPPDHFVEGRILAAGTNTSSGRGVMLYARMQSGENSGYRLRLARTTWSLSRVTDGLTTALASGTHDLVAPFTARLAASERTLTVYLGGSAVATVTDDATTAYLAGTAGFALNAAGADGASNVRLDDFRAGRL